MVRQLGFLSVGAGLICIAYVGGAVGVPPRVDVVAAPRPDVRIGQKTGYFNVSRVLQESERARAHIIRLNIKRQRMAANLNGLRAMHHELQKSLQRPMDPDAKHDISDHLLTLARLAEDTDRNCSKLLSEDAGSAITEIYADLHLVTRELAREHHLDAVLSYPGNPGTNALPEMELMLKSPAAHPFYLDPSVEFTNEVVQRLNAKFRSEHHAE